MQLTPELKQEIKGKVSIPRYFDEIIIPQMDGYYDDYTVDFESRPVAKCPVHDEDTPSFRFYSDSDSFYCFGCGISGDIFALHQKFHNKMNGDLISFSDTVAFLYKFFIQGQESTVVFKKPAKLRPEIQLNTSKEVIVLNRFVVGLEKTLLQNPMHPAIQNKVWHMIDTYSVLVAKNLLNATEAKENLETFYKSLTKA